MLLPFVGVYLTIAIDVGGEIAMAHDDGTGELGGEALQEMAQALALGTGTGVTGLAGSVETTLVADADGVLVVVLAVGSDLGEGTTFMDLPVAGDVVVVADVFPTSLEVVGTTALKGIVLRDTRGAAMQHD